MTTAIKLTDSQLVLLSAASRRDDQLLARPKYLRRDALDKLIDASLIEPVIVTATDPAWHEDDGNVRHGYRITAAGLQAIGIEPESPDEAPPSGTFSHPEGSRGDDAAGVRDKIVITLRAGSKRALVLSLLQQEQGASLDDLVQATGWLPHTTRAALSGFRKQGTTIERIQAAGEPSRYRVIASLVSEQATPTVATVAASMVDAGV